MGYREAFEAAGAEVLLYKEFGSYQGDFYAKIRFNGEIGWVHGSYGSCSGCDAFEAEFGWHDYDDTEKLASFGLTYVETLLTQDEAESNAAENIEWDDGAVQALKWLKENPL